LLGLLRQEDGVAVEALASFDLTLEGLRGRIAEVAGRGEESPVGQIPFTSGAKRALELSLREALALGHNDIGPEHILLGLVREKDGITAQVIAEAGATPDEIRDRVVRHLLRRARGVPRPASTLPPSTPTAAA